MVNYKKHIEELEADKDKLESALAQYQLPMGICNTFKAINKPSLIEWRKYIQKENEKYLQK
jgi:predicted metal-dependent peptidase